MKYILSFLACCLFTLGSCHICDEPTEPCIANPIIDCDCYELYDPVCGCDNITYGNACMAECANITTYTAGPCAE